MQGALFVSVSNRWSPMQTPLLHEGNRNEFYFFFYQRYPKTGSWTVFRDTKCSVIRVIFQIMVQMYFFSFFLYFNNVTVQGRTIFSVCRVQCYAKSVMNVETRPVIVKSSIDRPRIFLTCQGSSRLSLAEIFKPKLKNWKKYLK